MSNTSSSLLSNNKRDSLVSYLSLLPYYLGVSTSKTLSGSQLQVWIYLTDPSTLLDP